MEKSCLDCRNCKDISLNPNMMKLWCEEAEGEIFQDSIVMLEGAENCFNFQEKLHLKIF